MANYRIFHNRADGRSLPVDITGLKRGKLTVIRRTGKRSKHGDYLWLAHCSCGNNIEAATSRFNSGTIKSCGCIPKGRVPGKGKPESHVKHIYRTYQRGALARGYTFPLSLEQLLEFIGRDCHYCGEPPKDRKSNHSLVGTYAWNGIDRFDNSVGYEFSNCVTCCTKCNYAKGKMSGGEFLEWLAKVCRNLKLDIQNN